MYDVDMAEGITLSGQYIIHSSYEYFDDKLEKMTGIKKDVVVASDTDSVTGDTIIEVNGKHITIADYFDSVIVEKPWGTEKLVKQCVGDVTTTFDGEKLVSKNINYVMKHKVKKKLYKISCNGKSVVVTEDHSVKVINSAGILVDVKPSKLNCESKLVVLDSLQEFQLSSDFTVECIGECEEYVYDIEVEDTHSFFANGILVHNSCYIDMSHLITQKFSHKSTKEVVDIIDEICNKIFTPGLDKCFTKCADATNAFVNRIDMKRETIGNALFVKKKNYVIMAHDIEGYRPEKPKIKISGLEAVTAKIPQFFRKKLIEGYTFPFSMTEKDLQAYVKRVKLEYNDIEPDEIAAPAGVNGIEKYYDADKDAFVDGKTIPYNVKSACLYNRLVKDSNLVGTHRLITSGEKVKMIMLKLPNPIKYKYLAYPDKFPKELIDPKYVNRDDNYEKYFVKPLKRVTDIVNWSVIKINKFD